MATDTDTQQQVMITTLDNPWDPFTQYDEWWALDEARGYHSTGLLARYVITSNDLSDADAVQAVNQGIDELIRDNPFGMYKKVTPADFQTEN